MFIWEASNGEKLPKPRGKKFLKSLHRFNLLMVNLGYIRFSENVASQGFYPLPETLFELRLKSILFILHGANQCHSLKTASIIKRVTYCKTLLIT